MMSNFIHLQTKSHYSISCGLPKTNEIVDKAVEKGMDAVALADKNTFFGLVKFYNYAVKKGIKPICGVDFDVKVPNGYTNVILLAKNKNGLENLFKLSTESFVTTGIEKRSVPEEDIFKNSADLVCILPASSTNIKNLASKKEKELIEAELLKYSEAFKDNFFLGATCFNDQGYDQSTSYASNVAHEKNIPVVALNDVLFLEKEDHLAHQAKVAINNSTLLKDEIDNPVVSNEQYFKTREQLSATHGDETLNNTIEVGKLCNVFLEEGQYYLPSYEVQEGKTLSEHLEELAKNNLNDYLQTNAELDKNVYQERLDKELKIIIEKGYPGYFLIVMDFVKWAKEQEIPVGPGRGSGAGSLVAYMLSITALDPIEHGLLFERFLNPERMSLPDFDIDFCIEGRDKVIEYVQNKYGVDSVAQIGTLGTMAARGVTRDVTRILGKPYGFGDMIAKMIPLTPGIKLTEAIDESPEIHR